MNPAWFVACPQCLTLNVTGISFGLSLLRMYRLASNVIGLSYDSYNEPEAACRATCVQCEWASRDSSRTQSAYSNSCFNANGLSGDSSHHTIGLLFNVTGLSGNFSLRIIGSFHNSCFNVNGLSCDSLHTIGLSCNSCFNANGLSCNSTVHTNGLPLTLASM